MTEDETRWEFTGRYILNGLGALNSLIFISFGLLAYADCFKTNDGISGMVGCFCLIVGLPFAVSFFFLLPLKTQNRFHEWMSRPK